MFRRPARGGPGLASTVARTAVIAGTATAVSNSVSSKGAAKAQAQQQEAAAQAAAQNQVAEMQAQINAMQAQHIQAPAAAPAAGGGSDLLSQLRELGELKAAGILTDDEFSAAKAKLIAG
jgi:hypothetical protein